VRGRQPRSTAQQVEQVVGMLLFIGEDRLHQPGELVHLLHGLPFVSRLSAADIGRRQVPEQQPQRPVPLRAIANLEISGKLRRAGSRGGNRARPASRAARRPSVLSSHGGQTGPTASVSAREVRARARSVGANVRKEPPESCCVQGPYEVAAGQVPPTDAAWWIAEPVRSRFRTASLGALRSTKMTDAREISV
jgi:hypothetical protein